MDFSRVSGGIFTTELTRSLIHANHIFGAFPDTITEAFLPLSSTSEIYRVPGVLVPQAGERVRSLLKKVSAFHLLPENPLEASCSYLVRLRETLVLPSGISGRFVSHHEKFNLTLLADGVSFHNEISSGYVGELWALIVPREGPVLLHEGTSLGSLAFFKGSSSLSAYETLVTHHAEALFYDRDGNAIIPLIHEERRIVFTLQRDEPLFLHASSLSIEETTERIRLTPAYGARVLHRGGSFYLAPGFGNSSPTGLPLSLPLFSSQDTFWRPGQPLCTIEIIPAAQEKTSESALYTQAPPSNAKTE